ATENGATIRILVDTTVGMMPLQYASRRGREWMQAMSRERRDSELKSRLAFLYDRGFLISLVGNMIRLLMRGIQNGYELRFFDKAHREDAMAWLLED